MAKAHHRVAILGAGIGGLGLAVRLKKAGVDDIVVFEKDDGVGGTWRANTYPGAACDVPSHLYSYSFALNPHWSRAYSPQPEILAYLEDCADRFGVRPHLRCGTGVAEARWSDEEAVWRLRTETGETHTADILVSSLGLLNVPSYPDIPGLDEFAGPVFHSARWDHGCDLAGRRVAVIGTGASSVQIVPELAKTAERLTVFQRSAPWVLPRSDRAFTEQERQRLAERPWELRWQRWRLYWSYESRTFFKEGDKKAAGMAAFAEAYRQRKIADPELRARLTPDYPIGCKRVLVSSDYYPAMTRENVALVTERIEKIARDAVVTESGERHEVDAIVLATGFRAADFLCGVEVYGRGGRRLRDDWREGARAYLGVAVTGYPNFFMLYGPNTNQGGNSLVFLLEAQAGYVVRALRWMRRRRIDVVEVRRRAMERYNAKLDAALAGTVWKHCESYFRAEGGRIVTQLPHRSSWYWLRSRRFAGRAYRRARVR